MKKLLKFTFAFMIMTACTTHAQEDNANTDAVVKVSSKYKTSRENKINDVEFKLKKLTSLEKMDFQSTVKRKGIFVDGYITGIFKTETGFMWITTNFETDKWTRILSDINLKTKDRRVINEKIARAYALSVKG